MDFPCEIFLHMSKFMNFQDFKNLTLALWPNGGQDNAISKKLWQMSTCTYRARFCNSHKTFKIEFNYDPTRARDDRILINVDSLVPAFGGISLPVDAEFLSVPQLNKFIIKQIRSTQTLRTQSAASNIQHTSYHCTWHTHTLEERSHAHHLMWKHVSWWFNEYVVTHIQWRMQVEVTSTTWPKTLRRIKKKVSRVHRLLNLHCSKCFSCYHQQVPSTQVQEYGN
ncbi:repeat element 4 [Diadegma semiclausum ichnovirus]|nr:repeat element 4 [Diadegma semiclausum ichnovirus]